MRRRLRKKLHLKYLADVLYAISAVSAAWRARLFESPPGTDILVEPRPGDGLPPRVREAIRRHHLRYVAAQVPHAWARGDWEGYEEYVMFRVAPVEFPALDAYSGNNPETAYGRPWLSRTAR